MKIAVCTPVYQDPRAACVLSLLAMTTWTMRQKVTYNGEPAEPVIDFVMLPGSSQLDIAREAIAERALSLEPDYLLWLDADHVFPRDTFVRLARHDLPIVGCNYLRRPVDMPYSSASMLVEGRNCPIEPQSEGLQEVDTIGFGVVLIKASVFTTVPRPWFQMSRNGEDGYFCAQARSCGFRPVVDHALSMEVGHIAERVLTFR